MAIFRFRRLWGRRAVGCGSIVIAKIVVSGPGVVKAGELSWIRMPCGFCIFGKTSVGKRVSTPLGRRRAILLYPLLKE